jgi:hypothetical protein
MIGVKRASPYIFAVYNKHHVQTSGDGIELLVAPAGPVELKLIK